MIASRTDGGYYCNICQKDFYLPRSITCGSMTERTIPSIPYHKFIDTTIKSIQIECDTISLKHKDLDIGVCLDQAIDDIDMITINGNKFVRENNDFVQ